MKMNRALVSYLIVLLLSVAMDLGRAEDLEAAKFKLETSIETLELPLKRLKEYYHESLERLADKLQKEGNLDAILQVEAEQKRVAGETLKRQDEVIPELERLRTIYEKKQVELGAELRAGKKSLLESYAVALARIQTDYTKQGEIELAVECKAEIARVEAMLAAMEPVVAAEPSSDISLARWKAPQGGALRVKGDEMSLDGPGLLAGAAIAVSDQELAEGATLRGECLPRGKWTGFTLGNSQKGTPYLCVFSTPSHNGVHVELHIDGARRTISIEPGTWKAGEWIDFELRRKGNRFLITLGRERFRVAIPEEITGGYVGIVAFQESAMAVRGLKVE